MRVDRIAPKQALCDRRLLVVSGLSAPLRHLGMPRRQEIMPSSSNAADFAYSSLERHPCPSVRSALRWTSSLAKVVCRGRSAGSKSSNQGDTPLTVLHSFLPMFAPRKGPSLPRVWNAFIANNLRISSEMIRMFYGSYVKSVRYLGTAFVDREVAARDKRVEQLKTKYDLTPAKPDGWTDD